MNRGLLRRQDADVAAVLALVLKQHHPIDEREKGVVLAAAHIDAGFVARATLANQDRTRVDQLAAESLHSQPLSMQVAAVSDGLQAEPSPDRSSLNLDAANLEGGIVLPVIPADLVLDACLKFENRNF